MNAMAGPGLAMGGIFFLIWLLLMVGMIVGFVLTIVALWRGMKAHEKIAANLQTVLLKRKGE